jgi:hypothetical protein
VCIFALLLSSEDTDHPHRLKRDGYDEERRHTPTAE